MEMQSEINTSRTNCVDNIFQRENRVAPNTLRTPISLVLCSAIKEARPNIVPRQEINMAMPAKTADKICNPFLPWREFLRVLIIVILIKQKGCRDYIFLNTFSEIADIAMGSGCPAYVHRDYRQISVSKRNIAGSTGS